MLKLKRLLALSGLTGLLAAMAFAAPATADVKGVCEVLGEAKVLEKDETGGVQLEGGEGKFTFDDITIVCTGDTNKDLIPEPPDIIGAKATGWYDNTICGTGKALGTVTEITEADDPKLDMALTGAKFGIQFVATQGVFKWHDPQAKGVPLAKDDPDSDDPRKVNDAKNYTYGGHIDLAPPTSKMPIEPPSGNECTKAFTASGVVTAHFPE